MKKYLAALLATSALVMAGCTSYEGARHHQAHQLSPSRIMVLSGDQQVPANYSGARAHSSIVVYADGSVTGSVRVAGMDPTAAHLHMGAISRNGPVLVTLVRMSDGSFAVPAGTVLDSAGVAAAIRGHIYINVHSHAYPDGEIRAQLLRVM